MVDEDVMILNLVQDNKKRQFLNDNFDTNNMKSFSAKIYRIGVNPYVLLPKDILNYLFTEAGKEKGHIPVSLIINEKTFIQHLVKYSDKWRLYLNGPMRKVAGKDTGNTIDIKIDHDKEERKISVHAEFEMALQKNKKAKTVFDKLPPSRQKEIHRYISNLKTAEAVDRNIRRAINFLIGKERFIGRDKPL